jgi:hypothetical protein
MGGGRWAINLTVYKVTSPDGEKIYRYNQLGQLEGFTLSVNQVRRRRPGVR